jgi:hypothetical protein
MAEPVFTPAYVANLRRELTRALAQLNRAEKERDAALAENAQLRRRLAGESGDAAQAGAADSEAI